MADDMFCRDIFSLILISDIVVPVMLFGINLLKLKLYDREWITFISILGSIVY